MRQNDYYFLTRIFLAQRFNVKNIGSYIIIDYGQGKGRKTSVGAIIDENTFIDISNNQIRKADNNCKIYPSKLEYDFRCNEITLTSIDRMRVASFQYRDIEALYKYSWYQDRIIETNPLKLREPFLNKEFYARYFNVPPTMLQLGVLKYPNAISCCYRIRDTSNNIAIDIAKKQLVQISKEKCFFWLGCSDDFQKTPSRLCANSYRLEVTIPDNWNQKPQTSEIFVDYNKAFNLYKNQWYNQ